MVSKTSAKKMLDDKDGILALDPSGSFQDELDFADNLKKAVKNVKALDLPKQLRIGRHTVRYADVDKVVFAGMGGSAIAGDVVKDWINGINKVPMEAVRGYHLPAYVDEDTLVFLVSYSGDTEETLSCMLDAAQKGCKMVCISSNGAMQRAAKALKLPILGLPKMAAARVSFPYLLAPIPYVLAKLNILPLDKVEKEMSEATEMVAKLTKEYAIEKPFEKNYAKQAAFQIFGTVPIIYSYSQYRSVGLRFKTQVNENCKLPARCDVFPELDHNEIMSWEASKQILKHYTLILLRGPEEPEEVRSRIEVLKEKFFTKAKGMIEIHAQGQTTLTRMFHLLFTADMISLYLAVLLCRDPVASQTFKILKYQMTERLGTLERLEEQIRKLAED
jgi:glucose/mannose-6-phosphate isomerase